MSLTLVFRIQAVIFGLFGLGALLAPAAMRGSFNFEAGKSTADLLQGLSLMLLAMSYISWQMPNWAGDNYKNCWYVLCSLACTICYLKWLASKHWCLSWRNR